MPRYDYSCASCGARYERREGFDAPQEHPCEQCGQTARRVFVAPPILFKGSGWYITDSRSASTAATGMTNSKNDAAASSSDPAESAPAAPATDATPAKPESAPASPAPSPAPPSGTTT